MIPIFSNGRVGFETNSAAIMRQSTWSVHCRSALHSVHCSSDAVSHLLICRRSSLENVRQTISTQTRSNGSLPPLRPHGLLEGKYGRNFPVWHKLQIGRAHV